MNGFSVPGPTPTQAALPSPLSQTAPQPQAPHVRVIVVTDLNGKERKLFIPASLDLDRPKRPRTTFTRKQVQMLELEFTQNQFIPESRRQALAMMLGLTETQIKVWFQNRRTKFRRLQMQSPQPMSLPTSHERALPHSRPGSNFDIAPPKLTASAKEQGITATATAMLTGSRAGTGVPFWSHVPQNGSNYRNKGIYPVFTEGHHHSRCHHHHHQHLCYNF